jgi:chromosome segregation ATPase
VWAETQNQVARTHAHYEQLIAKERANTAEQLQNANAKVNGAKGEAQRFLMLYESSQQQNNKLLAEIAELRSEVAKVRRMTGREKGALEMTNRTLVKVMQGQEEEMEKLKNEWNVGHTLRVKLHAENQRLASELEEAKDKLIKVWFIFDLCVFERCGLSEVIYYRLKIPLTRKYEGTSRYGSRKVRICDSPISRPPLMSMFSLCR